ncbi:MAG: hypothetical protein KAJ23_00385 [Maribacter sp.]|nr:hypothetical protein [Maribacter sp.]
MVAIITGDIINSAKYSASEWMTKLKTYLSKWGDSPSVWEIYRGDEIQLRIATADALQATIQLKALMKSVKGLDIRLSIGIGDESHVGHSVSESNGTAYQRSGRGLERLKKNKANLMLATGDEKYDKTFNLLLKMALDFMDNWSPVSAEIVSMNLRNPNASQQMLAEELHIKQSAISQRQKRARLDLVRELLAYYEETINEIEE